MVSTCRVPGRPASWAGAYPAYTTRLSGPVSASSPIVPTWVPGKRAPSCQGGEGRRGVVLTGGRQPGDPRGERRLRAERRDVQLLDGPALEHAQAVVP